MMIYRFSDNISPQDHDAFVKDHPLCHLLQSSSWGNVKQSWQHKIIGVYQDGQLVASSLVLIRPLPLHLSMMYIPRGPILDYENEDLMKFYFTSLKKWAKKYHCLFIKMDPGIHYSDYHIGEDKVISKDCEKILESLKKLGLKHLGFTTSFHETIQPRFQMAVYQDEFDFENMTKKGKKNYKIALKKHFETKIVNQEGLEDFSRVMNCTAERKGISLRNEEYYRLLLDQYQENAFITLTYLDIEKSYQEIHERYLQCLQDLKECPEHAKKKRFKLEETLESLTREDRSLKQDLDTYGKKVCVCGTLSVLFGQTSEILYAGMDDEFKRYMGPYLTWYKTIEESFNRGCTMANMGGIEGDLKGGLTQFKSVFYPKINEFIGEFELPVSRLFYRLSSWLYKKRMG